MEELSKIRHARQAITIAEQQLGEAVAAAREANYSWADIGGALSISRQAAFKRFGTVTDPFTGETMTKRSPATLPEIAETFIRHLSEGKETETMAMIHPRVRKDLPWEMLRSVWTSVLGNIGAFEGFDDTQVTSIRGSRDKESLTSKMMSKVNGISVVVTTLVHEAGELMARVAIDADEAVVGVLILDLEATEYPF